MKMLTWILFGILALTAPASAGSISITVVQGGQSNVVKPYAVPDGDIDRIVAAYQSAANVDINGTATRLQVLQFITKQWMAELTRDVKTFEVDKAKAAVVVPAPVNPQ